MLGLLAAVLGNRAEFLACHFLPMVLKIVAITVQVNLLSLGAGYFACCWVGCWCTAYDGLAWDLYSSVCHKRLPNFLN